MLERNYPHLVVTAQAEKAIRGGHPWSYGKEIAKDEGSWSRGDMVDIYSQKGKWLGADCGNDAPILWGRLETDYLEFYIFQVV